ncbi:hypothetical protein [Mycolicibacterium septicum]|uniref:hypothetical protein n=1 Tax=Mycolicibacterium septicum TaxID=98668 RepID=UPI001AF14015|nr:hypothetical protein [Mycolicibacterium septicum]QRY51754.1 hypothetical protein JVX95_31010 [Mycolicibacterium septicum]
MLKRLAAVIGVVGIFAVCSPLAVSDPLVIKTAWDSDDHPALTNDITQTVNRVAQIHPEVRGTVVTTSFLPMGMYAGAGGRMIMFNDLYFSWPDVVNGMLHYDVDHGFHPPLGRCSPAEFIAYHESAHIIDQQRGKTPRMALTARYGGLTGLPLSGYSFIDGILNPGEALAEAFAAVQCNGGNPLERDIAALLN